MKKGFIAVWTVAVLFAGLLFSGSAFAFHPLITDDTGTQGKGKFQFEVNGQYSHNRANGVTEKETEVAAALTYGITDHIDIAVGVPYKFLSAKEGENKISHDGVSDAELDLKWQFYEHEGLSFALKPGVTFPTGDDDKGLGTGRTTYHLFFITSKEVKPWAFHVNLGYIRNENKADERKDIWHASLATEVEVSHSVKLVADIGVEKNPDRASSTNPAFILGGAIFTVSKSIDLDLGIKGGLNKAEPDYTILAGITIKF